MRDAIGGVVNITFIAIFMLIVSGYLAFSVSYNKAFKVKNKIISSIEQFQGYNEASKAAIEEYMKQIGYNATNPVNSGLGENCSHCEKGYCVEWFKDEGNTGLPKGYYRVVTAVDIDVPIFNKFLPYLTFFQTSGDTMTINASNSCPQ